MIIFLLILTIFFSTIRNVLSKNISGLSFGSERFFASQAILFLFGGLVLALFSGNIFNGFSLQTFFYALIYSVLLLMSQYFYTMSLRNGNIGICSTVYSFGFIFPTLSGCIFWNEYVSILNFVGILLVFPAIIISGKRKNDIKSSKGERGYIFFLLIAMVSSGGLGIMQKIQQKSVHSDEMEAFVIIAFALAALISFVFCLFAKKDESRPTGNMIFISAVIGVAFAVSNLLNTSLAGKLDSAVFFPAFNIGRIIASIFSGLIFYKEKISKRDVFVFFLGVISIILISVI